MSNLTEVTINNKTYKLDLEKAQELGLIYEKRTLVSGDVYCDPRGQTNSFIVVQVTYEYDARKAKYVLLGLGGLNPNSGEFFNGVHTLEEVEAYLLNSRMVFRGNINRDVMKLKMKLSFDNNGD